MSEVLLRTAERLTALIEHETAILRTAAPGDIGALQGEKTRLAQIWHDGVAKLGDDPETGPKEKISLAVAAQALEAALKRNEVVLRAMTLATDRVVAAMADAVREQRACGVGYGMRRQAPRTRAPASGIALDRKL